MITYRQPLDKLFQLNMRSKKIMTRWKASGIHFSICVLIALIVVSIMWFVWYPAPLFEALGGQDIVMMLIAIDVIVGPVLTWIVYQPFKKGLKFDLSVIAAVQTVALIYGISVLFEGRPVYMVFVKDRIDVVLACDIDRDSLARVRVDEFKQLPITGPKLAAAIVPSDPKERERILFSALDHGRDLQSFPEYFEPYARQAETMIKKSLPLSKLRAQRTQSAALIDEFVLRSGKPVESLIYLPVATHKEKDLSAVLDPRDGRFLGLLEIDPWI